MCVFRTCGLPPTDETDTHLGELLLKQISPGLTAERASVHAARSTRRGTNLDDSAENVNILALILARVNSECSLSRLRLFSDPDLTSSFHSSSSGLIRTS